MTSRRWRYQPVRVVTNINGVHDEYVCLAECHFDLNDQLVAWTDLDAVQLVGGEVGEDVDDLAGTLSRMLVACRAWPVVDYADLKVGMTIAPLIPMARREEIARRLEYVGKS